MAQTAPLLRRSARTSPNGAPGRHRNATAWQEATFATAAAPGFLKVVGRGRAGQAVGTLGCGRGYREWASSGMGYPFAR
ncbi:hypothetical protein CPLU01_10358 [Colletotrichum plurivorum]|uniref:Uncharacterized protein n=1 Tax=Colletotrichum plurivorum TaxID=2175906 RepID=A0A8H6K5N2_9PEZI|nr:hypothetical protein CPLU01_10358 [Colletotrichum plurivorum]